MFTRREMLSRAGTGLGMLGLAGLLADEGLLNAARASENPLAPKTGHFPSKVKSVIHVYLNGGPSHLDTFDRKPLLEKYAGQPLPTGNLTTERQTGAAFASPFK